MYPFTEAKRTLMISDIHGCIEPLNRMLEEIEYNSAEDQLILLGDYIDRGPKSREVVDRVIDLVHNHRAIALRGNHDQRLVDLIRTNDPHIQAKFMEHGGIQTLHSYCGFIGKEINVERLQEARRHIMDNYDHHIDFLGVLPYYYEDANHIYVHAGLNPHYTNWKEQPPHDFMYIKNDFIRFKTKVSKKVIFGHTRAMEIHGVSDVWFHEDKIGIDGGCAYGLQLNCLIFRDQSYTTRKISNSSASA
ncbi:metallophosphoesterase family protein [Cohnella lupini]|uniref:Serine/threonine protein phosphatase 1 n=1 Tax=Cohnella lupini TaxID=1294267 RepID=A0A3D9HZ63_9BACL|nr:metallophosphoesterase family protein [Cohnella lupini]RED54710.1 serine/threonine protein phosphatase 1 [Cohnella lupini]